MMSNANAVPIRRFWFGVEARPVARIVPLQKLTCFAQCISQSELRLSKGNAKWICAADTKTPPMHMT